MKIWWPICVIVVLIFAPDYFIPKIRDYLRQKLSSLVCYPKTNDRKDDQEWDKFSLYLGWIERSLYLVFFFLLQAQFAVFVGIWFALKVVGRFNLWNPNYDNNHLPGYVHESINTEERVSLEYRRRRADYMVFIIGTGLSLFWVLVISLAAKWYYLSTLTQY